MILVDKDLSSVQEVRILMERAEEAERTLSNLPQDILDKAVESMIDSILSHAEELAGLSVEETGYGNVRDEKLLLESMAERLGTELKARTYVGILQENSLDGSASIGVPLGIIGVLTPAVNPAAAAVYAAVICIKSGNAAVIAPHIRAQRTVGRTAEILSAAVWQSGCPEGSVSAVGTVAQAGILELLSGSGISAVLNIDVPEHLDMSYRAGRSVLYGAAGPSPVFIEHTADIKAAVEMILADRSFDGGILPGAEQYIVIERKIASKVKEEMISRGAYFMNREEEQKLMGFLRPDGRENDPEYMGKTVRWLAERAGLEIPAHSRVLVSEQAYISRLNPFASALRCPVLACYIEDDWMRACEKCMELLAQESGGHTLVIHSENKEVIRQFGLKKPVGRVLVNAPSALGAMGLASSCFPAAAPGGLTTGHGITAENITPEHLTYRRSLRMGTKPCLELSDYLKIKCNKIDNNIKSIRNNNNNAILIEALKKISSELTEPEE